LEDGMSAKARLAALFALNLVFILTPVDTAVEASVAVSRRHE
jgi:hypothetical protein